MRRSLSLSGAGTSLRSVAKVWRQLAALVGVGKTTIGEIERGERLPNVVTAIRIAKALHTTVEELWSEDYYGQ